ATLFVVVPVVEHQYLRRQGEARIDRVPIASYVLTVFKSVVVLRELARRGRQIGDKNQAAPGVAREVVRRIHAIIQRTAALAVAAIGAAPKQIAVVVAVEVMTSEQRAKAVPFAPVDVRNHRPNVGLGAASTRGQTGPNTN